MRERRRRRAAVPATLALLAFALYLVNGLALPSPWILPDERLYADGARALVGSGRDGPRTLWSLLVAPLWLADTPTGAALVRAVGALALALAVVPTYLLGRLLGGTRAAAAGAALFVAAAPAVYAGAIMPVAVGVLAAAWATLALARGGGRRPLIAPALLVVAAAVWPPLLPFTLVGLAVVAVLHLGVPPFLRWPGAAVLPAAAGMTYVAFHAGRSSPAFAAATDDVGATVAAAAAGAGAFAVGLGGAPLIVALAAAAGASSPRLSTLLLLGLCGLALSAGVLAVGTGRPVDDTPLLAVLPLVAAFVAAALSGAHLRVVAAATSAAAILALTAWAARPAGPLGPRSAGLTLPESVGISPLALVLLVLAAAAVLTIGLVLGSGARLSRLVAPAAVAVALPVALAGQVLAWSDARATARALEAGLGGAPRQVADVAGEQDVLLLGGGGLTSAEVEALLFWTPTARLASLPLGERTIEPTTGIVEPPLEGGALTLVVGGPDLQGETVAAFPLGTLIRPDRPTRAAETVEGLHPDGWSGPRVVYRRFSPPPHRRLEVTVSREAWRGPHVGGTVRVHVGPAGASTLAAALEVPERTAEVILLDVPPRAFEVVLELPTFVPAEFGEADARRLGAQVSFRYP